MHCQRNCDGAIRLPCSSPELRLQSANPILPVKTEFSSSAANINQLLAAAAKLCLVLGLGAARASLTHSAAHFRYLREATIECMGAELAFTSSLAIQYKWRPLQDYQPAVEIARRCVNQCDALPVRNSEVPAGTKRALHQGGRLVWFAYPGLATRRRVVNQLASSEGSRMPSAGSICERIGQRAGSTICRT